MAALDEGGISQFKAWVRSQLDAPGLQQAQTVLVKNGPVKFKSASLLFFGKAEDAISKIELRFRTSTRVNGTFAAEPNQWFCENEEIEAVRALLSDALKDDGDFTLLTGAGVDEKKVLEFLANGHHPSEFLAAVAESVAKDVEAVSDLTAIDGVRMVAQAIEVRRLELVVAELERLVLSAGTNEMEFQNLLDDNWWVLGAQFVQRFSRRTFLVLDQYDLLLVRPDGAIHVVELKRADVKGVVKPHRNHFRVGDSVHEAIGQAQNYLRWIDENRDMLLNEFGVECRRAHATVVIGHPDHNGVDEVSSQQYREAIRINNSHLSRIEVLTYEDVLMIARRSLEVLRTPEAEPPTP